MGPRSFNRGNKAKSDPPAAIAGASMGPRSFNRGNNHSSNAGSGGTSGFNGAAVFQPRKSRPDAA